MHADWPEVTWGGRTAKKGWPNSHLLTNIDDRLDGFFEMSPPPKTVCSSKHTHNSSVPHNDVQHVIALMARL